MKIAEILSKKQDITVLSLFPVDKKLYEKAYSLDLSRVSMRHLYDKWFERAEQLHLLSAGKVSRISKEYDIFINTEAHENVKPLAKRNIMICHFPELKWYRKPRGVIDGIKLIAYFLVRSSMRNYTSLYEVYCTSEHCREWLHDNWNINAKKLILYSDIKGKKIKKGNIVVSLGRLTRDKKYDFMIDCFKELYDSGIKNYRYVISAIPSDKEYQKQLEESIKSYPIKIEFGVGGKAIRDSYAKSKILFHAKGYGVDEKKEPQDVEHFGLVAVEGMSFGTVPVTPNKGGQREIVEQGKNGFLYETKEEAVNYLSKLMKDKKLLNRMSKEAVKRAKAFSLKFFEKQINNLIQ